MLRSEAMARKASIRSREVSSGDGPSSLRSNSARLAIIPDKGSSELVAAFFKKIDRLAFVQIKTDSSDGLKFASVDRKGDSDISNIEDFYHGQILYTQPRSMSILRFGVESCIILS